MTDVQYTADPLVVHMQSLTEETSTDDDIVIYGPEPPPLNSPIKHPTHLTLQSQPQPLHAILPDLQAFSWSLLAWCVVLLIFIASFIAIRLNGLFCPDVPNNTTQIKTGLMLADANFSAAPCLDFWDYACGTYTTTHLNDSVLSQLQRQHVAKIAPTLRTLAADYTPYSDTVLLQLSEATLATMGWFKAYSVDILPDIDQPTQFALYLTQDGIPPRNLADYTFCLPLALPCAPAILVNFLTTHHTVTCYMAINTSIPCQTNQSLAAKLQPSLAMQTLTDQLTRFWPTTIGTAFEAILPATQYNAINALCETVRTAAIYTVQHAHWLDAPSRALAATKLQALVFHIGYSRETTHLDCTAVSFWNCSQQAFVRAVSRLYARSQQSPPWLMSAIDVNAYYTPYYNAIYIPYGIATMPLFDVQLSPADNIAGLGAIIAHEIGHALDPTGVLYNAEGQYRPWLTSTSQQSMTTAENCLISLYNFTDNPYRTLGENFADVFSTMVLQYLAPTTNARVFWLNWAQTWCKVTTHLAPTDPIPYNTDVHAQSRYRVKGMTLQNTALATAYTCRRLTHPLCLAA